MRLMIVVAALLTTCAVDMPAADAGPLAPEVEAKKSSGASCDCGSGRYCRGPRGGTYCYTSGGNKRYVK